MSGRGNEIPSASRVAVRERSRGRCERCGGPGAQWHHRRSRSVRGEHRHCPCNGLWLCPTCHRYAHANPHAAIEEGLIVPRYATEPGGWSFQHYQGRRMWLGCDGSIEAVSTVETREE